MAALILYDAEHFLDVFSPFLWRWMLLYGVVIVAGGQLLLYPGLRRTSTSDYSLANSFSPIAEILAAYLILGEAPTSAQFIGGAVILIGIAFNGAGIRRTRVNPSSSADAMDTQVGFKGV